MGSFFVRLTGWLLPTLNSTVLAGKNLQYYQLKTVILYCIRCSLQFLKFMNVSIFGKCSLVTGTVDHLFVLKNFSKK